MADLEQNVLYALQFPKVTVQEGLSQYAGYLTDMSCQLLLIELQRQGLDIVRVAPATPGRQT